MPQPPWPDWLDPHPSFSRAELYTRLQEATLEAWIGMRRDREHETFYAFGFSLSDDGLTVEGVAASKQGLRRLPSAAPVAPDSSEETLHRLRWSRGEWSYQVSETFAAVNRSLDELRKSFGRYLDPALSSTEFERRWDSQWAPWMRELFTLYVDVLRDLDARGTFVSQPSRIILGVFSSDLDETKRSIERLNPAHQAERVLRDMKRDGARVAPG